MEFDDFILATEFLLENFPTEEALADFPMHGFKKGVQRMVSNIKCYDGIAGMPNMKMKIHPDKMQWLKSYSEDIQKKLEKGDAFWDTSPHKYPYIMGQFGSGFVFLKVMHFCFYRNFKHYTYFSVRKSTTVLTCSIT